MNIDANSVIGFLSGTLATLVIKWILERIDKKIEFKREISKLTHIRKLDKAEAAMAYFHTYFSRTAILKNSYSFISKAALRIDEGDIDIEHTQTVIKSTSELITKMESEDYAKINSVHLYFDLIDTKEWSDEDYLFLMQAMSDLKVADDDLGIWMKLHNESLEKNDDGAADYYWKEAMKFMPEWVTKMDTVIQILKKNETAVHSMIKKLKAQIEFIS